MDLHSNQIQGYFNCPVDNLLSSIILTEHIKKHFRHQFSNKERIVVVSPDVGGAARTVHYAKRMGVDTAIIHKSRSGPNHIDQMVLLGDVKDAVTIIVDDIVDTAGTLSRAANLLWDAGSKYVFAYATHGLFSGEAVKNINESALTGVFTTDSIQLDGEISHQINQDNSKFDQVSCANLLASAIVNIHRETSVSCLFE
jgi:ribose-phosphate pyrophosphokinase